MPKQQQPPPIVDEEPVEPDAQTVGEQLRVAREKQDVSLDDVAARTRIPRRHLESIEQSAWDRLPAATYTIGFAKSYASVVGLDRSDIGDRLREEMGGHRFATTTPEIFEPADPRRAMPKGRNPRALKVTVGSAVAPPVGPAGKVAANVSLLPADLMRGGTAAAPAPAPGSVSGQ